MTKREREYLKAMREAAIPELLPLMVEQLRKFYEVAERFDTDTESKEPRWYRLVDGACFNLDELRGAAKKQFWAEMKLQHQQTDVKNGRPRDE
jgi:hypothetical protein